LFFVVTQSKKAFLTISPLFAFMLQFLFGLLLHPGTEAKDLNRQLLLTITN